MPLTHRSVFISATACYSIYYVCRLSLSVAKAPLLDAGVMTAPELGLVGAMLFYAYGVGKLVNGFRADRADLKSFAAVGLLASAGINLALGGTSGFWLFAGLWLMNGWFQSMGAPAFVVALTRWFEKHSRGTYYGLWSVSHNLGEALTFVATAALVAHFGWRAGFLGAAVTGAAGALLLWLFFGDRTPARDREAPQAAPTTSTWAEQKALLLMPAVWQVALASALMYVARYAINSWGLFFLEKAKGYTALEASYLISMSAVAGIGGTMASGWISDRWFGGNPFKPAVIMGGVNTCALAALVVAPGVGAIDGAAMIAFGVSIGALICYLGGLIVVEIAPPKAAGAALGIVGIASYAGAGLQDIVSGVLIGDALKKSATGNPADFLAVGGFWIAAMAVSTLVTWQAGRARRPASPTVTPAVRVERPTS